MESQSPVPGVKTSMCPIGNTIHPVPRGKRMERAAGGVRAWFEGESQRKQMLQVSQRHQATGTQGTTAPGWPVWLKDLEV